MGPHNMTERLAKHNAVDNIMMEEDAFEETVVKVEVYESEREVTRALDDYAQDSQEERRLVRKIDMRLLPILGVMYAIQSMDRTGMNGRRLAGKARELYRENTVYSSMVWLLITSYLVFVTTSNMALSRSRPSRYLPGILLMGGIATTTVSMTGSTRALLMARLPLAAVEAAFLPGVLYVLSCWYKPKEIGKRIAIFPTIAILTQVIGAIIDRTQSERYPISRRTTVWQYMLLADGVAIIMTAIAGFVILPDYPATSRCLTRRERELATIRLIRHGQDTGSSTSRGIERLSHIEALFAAIRDPRVIVLSAIMVFSVAAGTLGHLLTTSTIQTGYSNPRSNNMAIPVYIVSAIVTNIVVWCSDATRDQRWHLVVVLGVALVAAATTAAPMNSGAKVLVGTAFAAGIWTGATLILCWVANAVKAPEEKRAIALALVHGIGGTASVFGSQMWPRSIGSRHQIGLAMSVTFLGIAGVITAVVPAVLRLQTYRGTRAERELQMRRQAEKQVEIILAM